jgi:DNA-nicking Smr family endonuclease
MDFGEVLDNWEKKRGSGKKAKGRAVDMQQLLSRYPPDKEATVEKGREVTPVDRKDRSKRLRALEPQAVVDLHGMTGRKAEIALERFLREALDKGLEKVLIVHGKGIHSRGEAVLVGVVRAFLEKCPFAGSFAAAKKGQGGRGATWVILRHPRT